MIKISKIGKQNFFDGLETGFRIHKIMKICFLLLYPSFDIILFILIPINRSVADKFPS